MVFRPNIDHRRRRRDPKPLGRVEGRTTVADERVNPGGARSDGKG
jgi:hypothetical protein